ncbi:uncharacterized protein EHS24_003806 [Apiotrichum porosum]|uniref:Uncharacterized protein n=1 Tax=Apiotrichum porosum TaxID=105984 RepID=A0A427XE38_9TREE|nr:uncharacterized protein EHS24_003806 [Apiotrichum porosum]RSH77169.1 hypothetical protein EHS24_003806 [Apiotrichum porosum]
MLWTYVTADIVTVIAQLAGTALTITFGKLVEIGVKTTTAGLWVQLGFFLSFIALLVIFGFHESRNGGYSVAQGFRSIYRVAEFTAGASSALGQSEVAFYLLDCIPNLLAAGVFLLIWPPACLDQDNGQMELGAVKA